MIHLKISEAKVLKEKGKQTFELRDDLKCNICVKLCEKSHDFTIYDPGRQNVDLYSEDCSE